MNTRAGVCLRPHPDQNQGRSSRRPRPDQAQKAWVLGPRDSHLHKVSPVLLRETSLQK